MHVRYSILIALFVVACKSGGEKETHGHKPVLTSLLGIEYQEPDRAPELQARLDSNLDVARRNFEKESSVENYVWYGRREAYLSHFNRSIDIFSEGIERFPNAYTLYRHRGHRYITIRKFDRAVADLQQAAALMLRHALEIEPDGQPNKLNIPLSTTQFNVWYHLGLAHYLKGHFREAEKAYKECMKVSNNDDLLCATTDWLYMTYRRQGKKEDASLLLENIHETMNIVENDSYHLRLLMYKGAIPPDSLLQVGAGNPDADLALATQGYGVGNWYLYNGDTLKAKEIFQRVVAGKHFSAFGFIAAEADLVRLADTTSVKPLTRD